MDKFIFFILGGSIVLNLIFIFCALIVAKRSDIEMFNLMKKEEEKNDEIGEFWK